MSGISLERLLFDFSSPDDGPNVGAFIRSADGSLITDTAGALDINIKSSDIDIRVDLDLDNLVADDAPDTEDPIKVGTRAVNSLAAISAAGDKANMISDLRRRLLVNTSANISTLATAVNVTNVATVLPATALVGRTKMTIQNTSNADVFIGGSGVTTANGILLAKGTSLTEDFGEYSLVYAIAATAGPHVVRVLESA